MCLFANTRFPNIAQEDIICYKVLKRKPSVKYKGKLGYFGLYYDEYEYENFDELNTVIFFNFDQDNDDVINIGLHSFATLECATLLYSYCKHDTDRTNVSLVKCIIPKGARYYEGHDCGFNSGYCSESLIIEEEVNMDIESLV